jgi:hypothetical protein
MSKHDARATETQKKKARRAIPRAKVSRPQGNTPAVRRLLKKLSGRNRAAAARAAAAAAV